MTTRVAMGGTFDHVHKGHRALLATAFRDGDEVVQIGVTRGDLATRGRDRAVRAFEERKDAVERVLAENGWTERGRVVAIDDAFGFALEPAWNALVVTRETAHTGDAINAARAERGLPPLAVRVAPYVIADDGLPLKATRVARGDVDADGKLLEPAVVAVGSGNPVKVDAARAAFRVRWNNARVTSAAVDSGVPEQPVGDSTWAGAENRARAALAAVDGAHFGVGLEAGLLPHGPDGALMDVQACVIVDKGGRVTRGHSAGFTLPPNFVRDAVEHGRTVGDFVGGLANDPDVGRKGGAIAHLTGGAFTRTALSEGAVLCALVPRLNPEVYGLDLEASNTSESGSGP